MYILRNFGARSPTSKQIGLKFFSLVRKRLCPHGGQLDLGVPELSGTTWKKAAKLQPAVSRLVISRMRSLGFLNCVPKSIVLYCKHLQIQLRIHFSQYKGIVTSYCHYPTGFFPELLKNFIYQERPFCSFPWRYFVILQNCRGGCG